MNNVPSNVGDEKRTKRIQNLRTWPELQHICASPEIAPFLMPFMVYIDGRSSTISLYYYIRACVRTYIRLEVSISCSLT